MYDTVLCMKFCRRMRSVRLCVIEGAISYLSKTVSSAVVSVTIQQTHTCHATFVAIGRILHLCRVLRCFLTTTTNKRIGLRTDRPKRTLEAGRVFFPPP